jgi:hypothetical protein
MHLKMVSGSAVVVLLCALALLAQGLLESKAPPPEPPSCCSLGAGKAAGGEPLASSTEDEPAPARTAAEEKVPQEKEATPSKEEAKAEKPRDPSLGGLPGDPKTTGAITGKVVLKGTPPEMKPLAVPEDNKDRAACGHEVPNERLLLGAGGVIANAVVSFVKSPSAEKPVKRSIVLDNVHCRFVPHVQATTVGSTLKVTTQDAGILHSAHSLATNSFNVSVFSPDKPVEQRLLRAGWMPIKCAVHGWMDAHIWVFPHDFFAVTSPEGKFRIEGVPPGKYEIKVWHEALEETRQEVSVEAGKASEVLIHLKPYE